MEPLSSAVSLLLSPASCAWGDSCLWQRPASSRLRLRADPRRGQENMSLSGAPARAGPVRGSLSVPCPCACPRRASGGATVPPSARIPTVAHRQGQRSAAGDGEGFWGYDSYGREYTSATEMWRENTGQAGIDSCSGDQIFLGEIGSEKAVSNKATTSGFTARETEGAAGCEAERGDRRRERWYEDGLRYWEGVEASVDGVLGGYGEVSAADIVESREFLLEMYGHDLAAARRARRATVALDCGAGVGRVSKGLLLPLFNQVDLLEPAPHFLAQAQVDLPSSPRPLQGGSGGYVQEHAQGSACQGPQSNFIEAEQAALASCTSNAAAHFFCQSLQDFSPRPGRYDVIWIQWCIGHLTDADLISFFNRAIGGLRPQGLLVLKENTCPQGFVLDNMDSSVTRSDQYFRSLFRATGLQILKSSVQKNFPKELFTVNMYALRSRVLETPSQPDTRN